MAEIKFEQGTDEVDETDECIQAFIASHGILDGSKQHQPKEPQNSEQEATTSTRKKRAPKNKFKNHETIRQSKSLLIKNAMHEEPRDEDMAWLESLSENELDMLISYKKIAMERATFIRVENVKGIFNFRALRAMGEVLKEFINENLKKVRFLAKETETKNILLEKKGGRYLEEGGECKGIEPIVKTEVEDATALETQNILLEENEGRLSPERVQEYHHIELSVEEELEEMSLTYNLKRKRDFSCKQEEICVKKQKPILNGHEQETRLYKKKEKRNKKKERRNSGIRG